MAEVGSPSEHALGCYGLGLEGIPAASKHLSTLSSAATSIRVIREGPVTQPRALSVREGSATLPLSDGHSWADLDRESATARLRLHKAYTDEELLHPLLSGTCALFNWWHGRDAFHAGAFGLNGRAWVVIGDKGKGKSTLLGDLAGKGLAVLSDDLVVEQDGGVLPGPSFVDLRPDAARELGVGRDMGLLGARPRYRVDVPATTPLPLAGWISLEWSDECRLVSIGLAERLQRLFANRAVLLRPASPEAFTRYVGLPFYELSRPRAWSSLSDAADLLISTL